MVKYCRGNNVIKYNGWICDSGNLQIYIDNHPHKHVPEFLGEGEQNPDLVEQVSEEFKLTCNRVTNQTG